MYLYFIGYCTLTLLTSKKKTRVPFATWPLTWRTRTRGERIYFTELCTDLNTLTHFSPSLIKMSQFRWPTAAEREHAAVQLLLKAQHERRQ